MKTDSTAASRSGVAQRQSIRLLTEGLWVRIPPPELRHKEPPDLAALVIDRGKRRAASATDGDTLADGQRPPAHRPDREPNSDAYSARAGATPSAAAQRS